MDGFSASFRAELSLEGSSADAGVSTAAMSTASTDPPSLELELDFSSDLMEVRNETVNFA